MQQYTKNALKWRGLDERDLPIKCERCEYRRQHPEEYQEIAKRFLYYSTLPNAVDAHHVEGRGGGGNVDNRLNDPRGIIFLCNNCHYWHVNIAGSKYKDIFLQIILDKKAI